MMTAAGTVPAAKIFVMGVGVAGLQAIATARRLGGAVTATDVRPATKEQVESLGAKFVAVEDEEFRQAETAGGYAKEMSTDYQAKQATLVASHIAKQDIVITTALIPGRPAPRLVSADMVRSMRRGSVIVDLAVERGGNCEGSRPGEVVTVNGVKILGHLNMPGRLAATASSLYARNLYAFVETLIDKSSRQLAIKWDDELVRATLLTHDGAVVHPAFRPKSEAGVDPSSTAGPPASGEGSAAALAAPHGREPTPTLFPAGVSPPPGRPVSPAAAETAGQSPAAQPIGDNRAGVGAALHPEPLPPDVAAGMGSDLAADRKPSSVVGVPSPSNPSPTVTDLATLAPLDEAALPAPSGPEPAASALPGSPDAGFSPPWAPDRGAPTAHTPDTRDRPLGGMEFLATRDLAVIPAREPEPLRSFVPPPPTGHDGGPEPLPSDAGKSSAAIPAADTALPTHTAVSPEPAVRPTPALLAGFGSSNDGSPASPPDRVAAPPFGMPAPPVSSRPADAVSPATGPGHADPSGPAPSILPGSHPGDGVTTEKASPDGH